MASYTDEQFENLVQEDLAWRRIELHSLKTQLEHQAAQNGSSPATRALARSMVTMLYAHWEGFSKCVFDHYANLIVRRRPVAAEMNDALLRAHASHVLKRIESGDPDAITELLGMSRGTDRPRVRLAKATLSDTKSNLRYNVLSSILEGFGMTVSEFETKQKLIDVLLCDRRNAVAHGRDMFPRSQDVISLHDDVIGLMESVQNDVVVQLRRKGYLRPDGRFQPAL